MGKGKLEGIIIPTLTPFGEDGLVNYDVLKQLIDRVIAAGVQGLIIAGSTGEFLALSTEERKKVLEVSVKHTNSRVPVYCATMAASTWETIEWTKFAEGIGSDGAMILPPWYTHPTEAEVLHHIERVAASTKLPLMIYNKPDAVCVNITPEMVVELAKIDNVWSLKDSHPQLSRYHHIKWRVGDGIQYLLGMDHLLMEGFVAGIEAAASGIGNAFPKAVCSVYELVLRKEYEQAAKLYNRLTPIFCCHSTGNRWIQKVKASTNISGTNVGGTRLPLESAYQSEIEELQTLISRSGLLEYEKQ